MTVRPRRDWFIGPLHVIVRGYREPAQYGCLLWSTGHGWTFDVWIHQTLWTLRWVKG